MGSYFGICPNSTVWVTLGREEQGNAANVAADFLAEQTKSTAGTGRIQLFTIHWTSWTRKWKHLWRVRHLYSSPREFRVVTDAQQGWRQRKEQWARLLKVFSSQRLLSEPWPLASPFFSTGPCFTSWGLIELGGKSFNWCHPVAEKESSCVTLVESIRVVFGLCYVLDSRRTL